MTIQKETNVFNNDRNALLVEDNIFCQKIGQRYIMDLGYKVQVVGDATTAIERVREQYYDLIVLDLGLPDQSGENVIIAARSFSPNLQTPLIIATAHADSQLQQRCLDLGADIVFIKPFTKQTLAQAIEHCHSQVNETATT